MLPHRSTTPKIASLLPRCERLMLAPRRAKKRVSALGCMRLRSDVAAWQQLVSSPSGKAKNFFPLAPHGQRTLLQCGNLAEAPLLTRVLSSRSPRHLTCTFIRLFFFKKQVTIRCLAILAKGASGVRRKDSGSAEDIFGRATSCH